MKKFFPLILAVVIGLGGYLYFNQKVIPSSGVEQVYIYENDNYKPKNPSPFIKLEKKKPIKTVVHMINDSESVDREINTTPQHYVVEIIYSKNKKETFLLWLNKETSSAMFKNKNSDKNTFHIVSKEDTNRLKAIIFR